MDIEPEADAWLHVYDGKNANYPRLAKIPVINGTMPQGLSSSKDYMYVVFKWTQPRHCPTLRDCVKFTIMIDSGPGEASTEDSGVRSTVDHFALVSWRVDVIG